MSERMILFFCVLFIAAIFGRCVDDGKPCVCFDLNLPDLPDGCKEEVSDD